MTEKSSFQKRDLGFIPLKKLTINENNINKYA